MLSSWIVSAIASPQWFASGNFLDCCAIENKAKHGVCNGVVLTLSAGCAVGCLVALVLNTIFPTEHDNDAVLEQEDKTELVKKFKDDKEDLSNDPAKLEEEA